MFDTGFLMQVKSLYPDVKIDRVIWNSQAIKGYHIHYQDKVFSVQFGPGNYCETPLYPKLSPTGYYDFTVSQTAEIAAWKEINDDWFTMPNGDVVQGWLDSDTVLLTMIDIFGN